VFGGALFTIEQWSCSIMFANITTDGVPATNTEQMQPPLQEWFLRPASMINPAATLEFVKLNEVNRADGKYTNPAQVNESLFLPPVTISGQTVKCPAQITSAITIHSEFARGRGSKGRFYPPSSWDSSPGTLQPDGRLHPNIAKGMADSAQELLSELSAAMTPAVAVVWSQAGQIAMPAVRVSCGRVLDTQRRRRSSLDEAREFATAEV